MPDIIQPQVGAASRLTRLRGLTGGQLALLLIVLLGLSLRLVDIRSPLLDAHRWRQVDTASMARFFYTDSFNPLYPQVTWGGAHGYTECELPLLPFLTALLYLVFGEHDWLGRVVAVCFSTATIWLTYVLAKQLLGSAAGRGAAFLAAVSPAAAFYGRAVMPDTVMLFFSLGSVTAFVSYFRNGRLFALGLGSLCLALACLAKLPALMILAPIAGAAWHARRWKAWRDWRTIAAILVALLVVAAWYWHAHTIYRQTGITVGVLGPALTYPPSIALGPTTTQFVKWSTWTLLKDPEFYRIIVGRIYSFDLMPLGLVGLALGLLVWSRDRWPAVARLWLLAIVAFFLVVGEGNKGHDYYQLPLVGPAALLFGAAAGPLFDGAWIGSRVRPGRTGLVLVATCLTVVTLVSFYFSGVLDTHYRRFRLDQRSLQVGSAIGAAVDRQGLTIAVDDYGRTSPMLLYFARLRGWSFDVRDLSPQLIDHLVRRQHARYFATSAWSRIEAEKPDVAARLKDFRAVPLVNPPSDVMVFELAFY